MNQKKRTLAITLLILLLLLIPPLWITYREYRQARLDHALIAAIKVGNDQKALEALADGANGEAHDTGELPTFRKTLLHLLANLQHRHRTQEQLPALVLLYQPKLPPIRHLKNGGFVRIGFGTYSNPGLKVIQALLDHGANANDQDTDGRSPLWYACIHHDNHADTVRLFLERSADPNLADAGGWTPLMEASDATTVELLLEHGANIEAVDNNKQTALMLNILRNDDNVGVIRALLEHGAKVGVRDVAGKTALDYARRNFKDIPNDPDAPKIIALLHKYGAK